MKLEQQQPIEEEPIELTKEQILEQASAHRISEVAQYQMNIDNFEHALSIIDEEYQGNDPVSKHMRDVFRPELEQRIIDEGIQQARSDIIRKAINREIAAIQLKKK